MKEHALSTRKSTRSSARPYVLRGTDRGNHVPNILRVCEKLVEGVFVVLQTHHGHQEALDHLPRLPPVVGLSVGTLQAVQSSFDGLQQQRNTEATADAEITQSLNSLFRR